MVNGVLVPLVDTMTCSLSVNTWTSATSSAVVWYTSDNVIQIDGGSTSKYRAYAGFFVTNKGIDYAGGAAMDFPTPSLG